jgi:K+-sensing histidine kinase KdpD
LGLEAGGGLEEVRRYLRLAREQAAALKEITSSSLSLANAGRRPKPICQVELTEGAIRIHTGAIEAKRIQVIKDLPGRLVAEVRGGEVFQAISNLVSNAIDALPLGGALHLRLRRANEAHLLVADKGNGISKVNSARVPRKRWERDLASRSQKASWKVTVGEYVCEAVCSRTNAVLSSELLCRWKNLSPNLTCPNQ